MNDESLLKGWEQWVLRKPSVGGEWAEQSKAGYWGKQETELNLRRELTPGSLLKSTLPSLRTNLMADIVFSSSKAPECPECD